MKEEYKTVLRGAMSPLQWLASGRSAVIHQLATSRAAVCVGCPLNGQGPLTQWFTEPASAIIRAAIERRSDWKLETPYDAALGVCEACYCPLPTKVHEPIDLVLRGLSPKAKEKLWDRCWIRFESRKPVQPETEEQ